MVAEPRAKATPDPARPIPPIRFIDYRPAAGRGYHINLMITTVLATLIVVPEPIYNLGQFLLGLFYFLGTAGGRH